MCKAIKSSFVDGAESAESCLAEDTWVIEPSVLVESINDSHLSLGQVEIKDSHVLNDTLDLA